MSFVMFFRHHQCGHADTEVPFRAGLQPPLAEIQLADPGQDLHRRANTSRVTFRRVCRRELVSFRNQLGPDTHLTLLCKPLWRFILKQWSESAGRKKVYNVLSGHWFAKKWNIGFVKEVHFFILCQVWAWDLGHVWRVFHQPSRPQEDPHRLRIPGTPSEERFPSHWILRGKMTPCVM